MTDKKQNTQESGSDISRRREELLVGGVPISWICLSRAELSARSSFSSTNWFCRTFSTHFPGSGGRADEITRGGGWSFTTGDDTGRVSDGDGVELTPDALGMMMGIVARANDTDVVEGGVSVRE